MVKFIILNGNYTERNWEVTFKIIPADDTAISKTNLKVGNINIYRFTVTPIGIYIENNDLDLQNLYIKVTTNEKDTIEYNTTAFTSDIETNKAKYIYGLSIKIDNIKEIKINDVTICFKFDKSICNIN